MDSKVVNRAIAAQIWEPLKGPGFAKHSSRAAWRFHANRTDVVIFRSFNAYNAGVLRVTTCSFWIELGCYLKYVPPSAWKFGNNPRPPELPKPEDCEIRGKLHRGFAAGRVDRSIWPVAEQPGKLAPVIDDARRVLLDQGIRWFEQFHTANDVYALLREREEDMDRLWGFGRPGSPVRHHVLGYVARHAGLRAEAREHLLAAASTATNAEDAQRLAADTAALG